MKILICTRKLLQVCIKELLMKYTTKSSLKLVNLLRLEVIFEISAYHHPTIFLHFPPPPQKKKIDKIPKLEILRNFEISLKLIIHKKLFQALSEWFWCQYIFDVKTMKNGEFGVGRNSARGWHHWWPTTLHAK